MSLSQRWLYFNNYDMYTTIAVYNNCKMCRRSLTFVRWQYDSVRKQLNSVVVVAVKFESRLDVG